MISSNKWCLVKKYQTETFWTVGIDWKVIVLYVVIGENWRIVWLGYFNTELHVRVKYSNGGGGDVIHIEKILDSS